MINFSKQGRVTKAWGGNAHNVGGEDPVPVMKVLRDGTPHRAGFRGSDKLTVEVCVPYSGGTTSAALACFSCNTTPHHNMRDVIVQGNATGHITST